MLRILTILLSLFLIGCSSSNEDKNVQIQQLNEELVELKRSIQEDDSTVNYYVDQANIIHDNIDLISAKQKEILQKIKEDPSLLSKKNEDFNKEINDLSELVEQNRTHLTDFKTSFSKSSIEGKNIGKLIDIATVDMEEKNQSIVDLQIQLDAVDVAFEDLFSVFGETLAELDETKNSLFQTKSYLNTVWYVIDTKKSLEEKGIISVEGGFIGIGTNEALSSNLDIANFTKGNKNTMRKIKLPSDHKKFDFVTSHPKDSYEIKGIELNILNPNDFWSISKYLVIALK